ncbi:DNA sulfur modification protein DndB [Parashewanella spongiae]|uniref:DNA sulfur modification protein DndB n=1 Tax=Parashewanella spongiae TaxID=342950 RepID=A0A3A6TTI4_9GAMM|nr:DNA sulfur modification protein DndB [Parashewanella spongiae]MCL1076576.1 DNA sulfur modification protein DndB [Parashewanella spongiae]RJY19535.1 DNA sulfur modification protein DndB [Parashewanella spongiae]
MYEPAFEHVFPAIKGIQAGQEYYVTMCPLKYIPKIFEFHEDELAPEYRAQRTLNDKRIPGLKRYLTENKKSYVFSSITASIAGKVSFVPMEEKGAGSKIGALKIDMDSILNIIDGQHRRAAIEAVLADEPDLANETISVVFFVEKNLSQRQQMFADLNLYQVKVNQSVSKTYNQRDEFAQISREVAIKCKALKGLIDFEQTKLSKRSRKLFTHNALNQSIISLLKGSSELDIKSKIKLSNHFYDEVAKNIAEWDLIKKSKITAGESREDFIHSHSIFLHAIGIVGNQLITSDNWETTLSQLCEIDWHRSATELWEGRCVFNGRLQKNNRTTQLTANLIKQKLGLQLSKDELKTESTLERD